MPGFALQHSWVRHTALILPDAWHGFASRQRGLIPLLAMGPYKLAATACCQDFPRFKPFVRLLFSYVSHS